VPPKAHFDPVEELREFLDRYENRILRKKVVSSLEPGKYEFLLKAMMAMHEMSLEGQLEFSRFMVPFRYARSPLTKDEIWHLVEISKQCTIEIEEDQAKRKKKIMHVSFYHFLRALRKSVDEVTDLFVYRSQYLQELEGRFSFDDDPSEISSEIDPEEERARLEEERKLREEAIQLKCTAFDAIETDSFDGVEGGYDEVTVVQEEEPEEVEISPEEEAERMEQEEEERLVGKLEFGENFSVGKFEVVVNHCYDCYKHYHYSRHSEDEHVNQFNDLGDAIQGVFPSAVILGNIEKVPFIDEFEVYIRGAGFYNKRDSLDRFMLYRKSQHNRFPEKHEIIDQLICLALIYGDSTKLELAQQVAMQKLRLPPPCKNNHGHPCDMPDIIQKQPKMEREPPPGDIAMVCA